MSGHASPEHGHGQTAHPEVHAIPAQHADRNWREVIGHPFKLRHVDSLTAGLGTANLVARAGGPLGTVLLGAIFGYLSSEASKNIPNLLESIGDSPLTPAQAQVLNWLGAAGRSAIVANGVEALPFCDPSALADSGIAITLLGASHAPRVVRRIFLR